jgi:hypothetical protein
MSTNKNAKVCLQKCQPINKTISRRYCISTILSGGLILALLMKFAKIEYYEQFMNIPIKSFTIILKFLLS